LYGSAHKIKPVLKVDVMSEWKEPQYSIPQNFYTCQCCSQTQVTGSYLGHTTVNVTSSNEARGLQGQGELTFLFRLLPWYWSFFSKLPILFVGPMWAFFQIFLPKNVLHGWCVPLTPRGQFLKEEWTKLECGHRRFLLVLVRVDA
jgi:hypothetical protein